MVGECQACAELRQMDDDETETVTFSALGVEMTLQGLQVRRNGRDRVDVSLPTFKSTCDGTQKTAIVLPPGLFEAIGLAVAQASSTLDRPLPALKAVRDLLGASSLGSA